MAQTLRARGIRFLTVLVPTLLLLGALAGSAQAALLLIDGSGKLTGATGVTVGGATYNVSFEDGTCVALFSGCDAVEDFVFQTQPGATAAAQALLDQVFLDGPLGSFDTDPTLTRGCSPGSTEPICIAGVPYELLSSGQVDQVFGATAVNALTEANDNTIFFTAGIGFSATSNDQFTYAVFSPVPEPATLTLLGLGCAGLGLARRRRRAPTRRFRQLARLVDQREIPMRKLVIAFFVLAALGLAAPPVQAGPILFQWAINQDGVVSDSLADVPPNWSFAAFDTVTGLGTITASIISAGAHNLLVFLDLGIDQDISNEFGSPGGPAPGPGFEWEIDEPGHTFGDIYDNFLVGALDGLNGVPAGSPNDVSFALGWDFILGPDEVATLNFRTSLVAPDGVPHLIHTDPDSDLSVYFSSDLTIRGGGEPPIPEPSTLTLVGLGLAAAARRLRRRG